MPLTLPEMNGQNGRRIKKKIISILSSSFRTIEKRKYLGVAPNSWDAAAGNY